MEFPCPCCQKNVTEAHLSKTIELLKSNGCEYEATDEFPITFSLPYSKWACDTCLKNKKAILANITQQNYFRRITEAKRFFHLAYMPLKLVCKQCKKSFKVSIKQQQRFYEVLKRPIKVIPTICFDCHKKGYDSPEEKKIVELTLHDEPMGKKRLIKFIAVHRAINDLENMQKYQLMLDNLKQERNEKKRDRIAELTQNGDPTDFRSLTELKELYFSLGDGQNTKKYNTMAKQLKYEWWLENVKPNLNKKSVVEPQLVPKTTPINVQDTPVMKAKRKRIVKSFVEPENLESEVEPADDGFFYGFWDE